MSCMSSANASPASRGVSRLVENSPVLLLVLSDSLAIPTTWAWDPNFTSLSPRIEVTRAGAPARQALNSFLEALEHISNHSFGVPIFTNHPLASAHC